LIDKGVACDKVFVVPHGDYSYYTEWSKGLIQEKNTVLFFGLIREYKGLEYLIRAVPTISSSIPELKVIIAGDGDFTKYESLIDNTAHFEIHNRFIPDEEVSDLFERASVVVLPYTEASQSGVVPIAYAFKKPVVATNVGSLIEVVEDGVTGFVVPPRNTEALSDAIIKILENECLRKKMGENGYENMKKKMSWEEVAQNTVQIYNKMCI
jgi:glycosyltransferase involved in cell wall biosynthesis